MDKTSGKNRYQKNNRKIMRRSILLSFIVVIIGVVLFTIGFMKVTERDTTFSGKTEDELNQIIENLLTESGEISNRLTKENEENGLSDKYYEIMFEYSQKNEELANAFRERAIIKNEVEGDSFNFEMVKNSPTCASGIFIIIIAIIFPFVTKFFINEREKFVKKTNEKLIINENIIKEGGKDKDNTGNAS